MTHKSKITPANSPLKLGYCFFGPPDMYIQCFDAEFADWASSV